MRFVASLLLALALAGTTAARAADYLVLIDADQNAATGCQVVLPVTGTLDGFEHRLTASVDAGATPPMVTGVTLETCQGGVFGAASAIGGGYPVGVGQGAGGGDVVEIAVSQALLSGVSQSQAHIVFAAVSSEGDDATAAVLFQILALAAAIPSLSTAALMLLATVLALAARRQLGHPAARHLCAVIVVAGLAGGLAIAANFAADGAVGDWVGTSPLVGDAQGDGGGDDNVDLRAGFAAQEAGKLFFRMDVVQVRSNGPQVNPASFAIAENSPGGTVVGTATLSDPMPGLTYTFAITGGNGTGAFTVDPATGQITVADPAPLNFETTPVFSLQVTATDDFVPPRSGSATVTVQLTNVNEAPAATGASFSVQEGSPAGTVVGTVGFTDPDAGQGHGFAITGGNTGGAFAIHPATGQITVVNSAPLVFATNPSFTLTVAVTDDGTPPLSGNATVTVSVTKVNQAPTVQDATFTVDEHSPAGSALGAVTATDGNAPPDTLGYAITAGNPGGVFAIDGATGTITVADPAALDFETTPSFSLTVTVTDDGSPVLSATGTITVNLNDVNDRPTVQNGSFALDERSPDGTVVGTVTATDQDLPPQNLSFAITGGNTGNAFAIDAATGQITVATSDALDHATNPSFSLTVTVTDDGAPPRPGTGTVTVNLNDLNETPAPTGGPFSLSEQSAVGTVVGTVLAGDPDAGQSHTFTIVGGNTGNAFAIDPGTGQITVADNAALDYETNPSFTLQVQATDNATPPLSGTGSITVALVDVNESPTLTGGAFGLPENSANDTVAGSVSVSDPDVGQSHGFTITAGNTNGAFAINGAGQIVVANTAALDYETNPVFTLTVQATDNGSPALSDTAAVTVSLTNVNEPPTAIAKSYDAHTHLTISVPAASGLNVGNSDPEGDAFALASVTASTPPGALIAFAADGGFDFTAPPGVTGNVSFGYRLCDTGTPQQCADGTVTVAVAGPVVWFVDDDAAAGGNGTMAAPFKTLADVSGVHAADHRIFVSEGSYADGIALASGERLIGQGASGSFDDVMGLGTIPLLTNSRPALGGTAPSLGGTVSFGSAAGALVRGVEIATTGATGLTANGATSMSVTETRVISANAMAVSLANSGGTVSLSSTTSTGGVNNVALTNMGGTVSLGGGALSGASGAAFSVSGSSASVAYAGTVTNTTQGVRLTSNTGTVSLSGTLNLSTGANAAFLATGGGTVTATGSNSTLATTTATALEVSNTTIGAAGLTFRSISSSGGSNPGIVLSSTGSSGGLAVTGTGAADSGGTIQGKSGLCMSVSGGRDLHLSSMTLQNCAGGGLLAANLENFSLTGSTVSGNGDAVGEHGLHFTNLTGTAAISSSTLSGSGEDNLHVANTSGTLAMLNISGGCVFTGLSTSPSNDGIYFAGDGTAVMSITVDGCTFTNHRGDHFQLNTSANTTASVNATFINNTLTGAASGPGGAGVTVSAASAAQVGINLANNQITGARSSAITLYQNNTSTAGASFKATVANNTIGNPAVDGSGSSQADGITVIQSGAGTMTALIDSNLVRQYTNAFGIQLRAGDGAGALNATVIRNTVSNPASGILPANGIHLNAGQITGDTTAVCLALGGPGEENALVGSGANGQTDFRLRQRMSTTVMLPGYGGGATDTAAVVSFVQGNNTGTPSGSATVNTNGFSNGGACPQP